MQKEEMLYNVTTYNAQIKQLNYKLDIQRKLLSESISIAIENNINRKKELEKQLRDYNSSLNPFINEQNTGELSIMEKVYAANETFYNQLLDKKAQYTISKAGFVSQNIIRYFAGRTDFSRVN